ncbi:CHRD domain-containing protein [Duganella sp. Dugasp56]|uniref:CHRD domain-containing protein n=1 Tax=Duganella sp. Dugasp56 TaxID=3243046 RepID=UPI0039B0C180
MKKYSIAMILALVAAAAHAGDTKVVLTGAEETPAVATSASGNGTISVGAGAEHAVSGGITTKEVQATAAHIHLAAPGKSGPPVITLAKTGDNTWSVPAGATLNDEQYASYLAGNLYINVHSADHKPGEIRGQLRP